MEGPGGGGSAGSPSFTINGVSMDMNVINETVPLGAVEEWIISNHSVMEHPFHIHDVQFLVRSRNGVPPPEYERGWKDTVQVWPGDTVSVLAHFTDYADPVNPYMYHCHILQHEDLGMMGQFVVV
jgi:FtsP/CotA-like multicopper oxidase with cupredoxin domain